MRRRTETFEHAAHHCPDPSGPTAAPTHRENRNEPVRPSSQLSALAAGPPQFHREGVGARCECARPSQRVRRRVESHEGASGAKRNVGSAGATDARQVRARRGRTAAGALDAAQSALAKGQQQQAERSAAQAHLYAELAVAKSQSADARKSANEVLESVNTLRQETERTTPTQR